MVAVDDSSSMNVNEVRRTAYQSLATLCGALSTLEVGKFGLLSFGNEPKLVHPLQANFSHEDGAHLLKTLTFEQVHSFVVLYIFISAPVTIRTWFIQMTNTFERRAGVCWISNGFFIRLDSNFDKSESRFGIRPRGES